MDRKLLIAGSVFVLALVGGVAVWQLTTKGRDQSSSVSQSTSQAQRANPETSQIASAPPAPTAALSWQQTAGGWQAVGSVPDCPAQPMMTLPADLSQVTSILYPGQTRGGNYKPHGGFRFDNRPNNDIAVEAPLDGFLVRGSRYLELGEVQYAIDIMHNCGIMYRFDHLRVLSPAVQAIADTWPAPSEGDSRTNPVQPPLAITQGMVLATSVGFEQTNNVGFDWGVYDFRTENEASASAAYQAAHAQDAELAWHAVCWFDWLPRSDQAAVRGLPAGDSTSGTASDYCK